MSRLAQGLKYLLIVLLVSAGVGISGGYFCLQYRLGSVLEAGISKRLGVTAQLGFARFGVMPPALRLNRIVIGNPPGYQSRDFMRADDLSLQVSRYDYKNRVLHSPRMTLDGLHVWIESRQGRTNSAVIKANQRRYDREHGRLRDDKLKFIIQELHIRDLQAHLQAGTLDRRQAIPELVLYDIGSQRGGVTAGELAGIVADAALRAALKAEARQEIDEYVEKKKRDLGRKLEELWQR